MLASSWKNRRWSRNPKKFEPGKSKKSRNRIMRKLWEPCDCISRYLKSCRYLCFVYIRELTTQCSENFYDFSANSYAGHPCVWVLLWFKSWLFFRSNWAISHFFSPVSEKLVHSSQFFKPHYEPFYFSTLQNNLLEFFTWLGPFNFWCITHLSRGLYRRHPFLSNWVTLFINKLYRFAPQMRHDRRRGVNIKWKASPWGLECPETISMREKTRDAFAIGPREEEVSRVVSRNKSQKLHSK